MPVFALNHVTVPRLGYAALLDLAAGLGCGAVEVRNDLGQPLFDGLPPAEAGAMARGRGLRLAAVAEVKGFNDWTPERRAAALALMRIARDAGAEAIGLIPRNDGFGLNNGERQANLRVALRALAPMLDDHGLIGLVEPLGFARCSLRDKAEAAAAIAAVGGEGRFRLIHDSFHHALAGGAALPEWTGLVHVSGVADPAPALADLADAHRGLPDAADRLGTRAQLRALVSAGWDGVVSLECFAPAVQELAAPRAALAAALDHLRAGLAEDRQGGAVPPQERV